MDQAALMRESRSWVNFENQGEKIFGVLHRPSEKATSVVIILHGFASNKQGSNRAWVHLAEALSHSGIAALRFDFRGCGDSEGTFSQVTLEDLVEDALKACTWADQEGFEKKGFFGSSLGGAIGILAAAKRDDISSLALWSPVASGQLWYQDFLHSHPELNAEDPEKVLSSYQGIPLNPLFREQFSQMFAYQTLLELSEIPLLHMHGEKDETLSLNHQKKFEQARERAQAESRFIIYPETSHVLGYSKVFPTVLQEIVSWFNGTL